MDLRTADGRRRTRTEDGRMGGYILDLTLAALQTRERYSASWNRRREPIVERDTIRARRAELDADYAALRAALGEGEGRRGFMPSQGMRQALADKRMDGGERGDEDHERGRLAADAARAYSRAVGHVYTNGFSPYDLFCAGAAARDIETPTPPSPSADWTDAKIAGWRWRDDMLTARRVETSR